MCTYSPTAATTERPVHHSRASAFGGEYYKTLGSLLRSRPELTVHLFPESSKKPPVSLIHGYYSRFIQDTPTPSKYEKNLFLGAVILLYDGIQLGMGKELSKAFNQSPTWISKLLDIAHANLSTCPDFKQQATALSKTLHPPCSTPIASP